MNSIKKNSIYNILKTGSAILFPLITFPYISRVLLTENVGKINFGQSIVSYFSLIASLGINTYAIRECSAVRDDKQKLSRTSSQIFSINIITTVASYIALAVTLIFYNKLYNYRILIILQSMGIILTTLGTEWLNSAMEDFKYITIRTIAFQILSLMLMFIFVHESGDYIIYVIISLISSAGANILNIWYRKRFCKLHFTMKIEWKKHFVPIILLFVMLLAQTIFNSVDSTMLGLMNGDYEVGIYSTAHKISNLITQLVASLLWVIMPRMSYYYSEGNYSEINKLLRKVLGFNATVGLPLAVGTFMMSDEIILVIAGQGYYEAGNVLRVLMIGFVFTLFGGSFLGNCILLPSRREKTFMIVCCIAAVVNIFTNYIFIPKYGAIAAAWTTSFCAFVILFILMFTVDKNIKLLHIPKLLISPIIGCVGIISICLICRSLNVLWVRAIISVVLSIIVYVLTLFIFKNELLNEAGEIIIRKFRRR